MSSPENYFALLRVLDSKGDIVELLLLKPLEARLSSHVGFGVYPSQQLSYISQAGPPTAGQV